jgi:hypothetical protein
MAMFIYYIYIYIYIYIYDELIQIFRSALRRFVSVLSYLMPWIDFLMKAPFRDHFLTFREAPLCEQH